jgi:hypothetical protein
MNRLSITLGVSHVILFTAAGLLFLAPSGPAIIILGIGAFVRWMVPHKKNDDEFYLSSAIRLMMYYLIGSWLLDLGASDLIAKAWDARLSPRPIIGFFGFLIYFIARDWIEFRKKSPKEIEEFYATKTAE